MTTRVYHEQDGALILSKGAQFTVPLPGAIGPGAFPWRHRQQGARSLIGHSGARLVRECLAKLIAHSPQPIVDLGMAGALEEESAHASGHAQDELVERLELSAICLQQ